MSALYLVMRAPLHDGDPRLDRLLRAWSEQRPPACPPGLEAAVWREIRQRRESPLLSPAGWWSHLLLLLARPAPAFAALMLAISVGLSAGVLSSRVRPQQVGNYSATARRSLHLDVFSPDAPGLPSTLITRR